MEASQEASLEVSVGVSEEKDGRVARLRLAAPGGNPLDLTMLQALQRALDAVARWPRLVAVILEGAGHDFSTGLPEAQRGPPFGARSLASLHDVARTLLGLDALVISLVRGRCEDAGAALALTADIVVADSTARLALVTGDVPMPLTLLLLAERLDRSSAAEVLLPARTFTGEEAAALRIVSDYAGGWDAASAIVERYLLHLALDRPREVIAETVRHLRAPILARLADAMPDLERTAADRLTAAAANEQTLSPRWRPGQ